MTTLGDLLRQRAADPADAGRAYLRFEDRAWTFAETHREACRYANLFRSLVDPAKPMHVGLLLENRPEFVFAELGAALGGAVVVGLNPTRRGEHLARDIAYSDCQVVVTEPKFAPLLAEALATPGARGPRVLVAEESLEDALAGQPTTDPEAPVGPEDLCVIVFTSGTTAGPKGVLRSHGKLTLMSLGAAYMMTDATRDDVVYCAMPLFHANAQILALGMSLAVPCTLVLVRRFSKTAFLPDIRRYGATLFNYVGSPLAYVMDTPERPDDADNPLRLAYGNEGPRQYLDAFARRFGCRVVDGYGSSEVGVSFSRAADDPPGVLGRAGAGVKILREDGSECAVAELDAQGRLVNPEDAIGEIVNVESSGMFEGYWKNDEATTARTRGGRYYTGDLGYRDAQGYVYFAGRDVEWLRVDGENFLARPVEEILERHPDVFLCAVYGVPDAEAGDRAMVALELRAGATFDPEAFARFVDGEADLSPKWRPTYVRVARELKRSETNKVLKRDLQREGFLGVGGADPLWWRPRGAAAYEPFTIEALSILRERFARAGNLGRLGG
ncbi:MAG TPA: AMP-binding protein [Candidatus Eisenbacteria bacterium]|nr:AMP-binding protein [Candidatus Eisenbacteria bacterium]